MADLKKEPLSFEEALNKLTLIVEKLESDEASLEESIKLFEEGMNLSRLCSSTLENAELRIEQVNQKNSK